jgi:sentrin-specific protease 1
VRLRPLVWLNDEVINSYGNLVQQRADANGAKVHVFSSFFYTKMQAGYNKMFARWTKKVSAMCHSIGLTWRAGADERD